MNSSRFSSSVSRSRKDIQYTIHINMHIIIIFRICEFVFISDIFVSLWSGFLSRLKNNSGQWSGKEGDMVHTIGSKSLVYSYIVSILWNLTRLLKHTVCSSYLLSNYSYPCSSRPNNSGSGFEAVLFNIEWIWKHIT